MGALILLAALYLAFRWIIKKRGNFKAPTANCDGNKETHLEDTGYYDAQQNYVHPAAEVQGTPHAELPAYSAARELNAEREYREMQ